MATTKAATATKTPFQGLTIGIGAMTGGTAPATYTPIGCFTSFTLSGITRGEIDITCAGSTSKEFTAGLKDNGSLSVDLFADQSGAGWLLLEAALDSTASYGFEIVYPDGTKTGTTKTFEGVVTALSESGSVDGMITGTVDIKISGDVTKVAATQNP